MPIDAFCVEHSRWTQRGMEPMDQFSMSEDMVATKDLKLAMKAQRSQARLWNEVEVAQGKLSAGVNVPVPSRASPSSLQLALENDEVQKATAAYIDKLSSAADVASDVIGFAFAINNKLNSADVYASNAMFKRFWPRLLKSAAIEAVAERPLNTNGELVSIAAAGEFLIGSERGAETLNEVTTRTHMIRREAEKSLFFETRDMAHGGAWIHRSYLTK